MPFLLIPFIVSTLGYVAGKKKPAEDTSDHAQPSSGKSYAVMGGGLLFLAIVLFLLMKGK